MLSVIVSIDADGQVRGVIRGVDVHYGSDKKKHEIVSNARCAETL